MPTSCFPTQKRTHLKKSDLFAIEPHSPLFLPIIPLTMAAVLQSQQTLLSPVDDRNKGGGGGGEREEEQLSLIALLLTLLRKSLGACRLRAEEASRSMEIGWPTNVRHVAHVTFDRFHGFLGLPDEFEPEVPRRAPSARFFFILPYFLLASIN